MKPTELLKFFNINNAKKGSKETLKPYAIIDFINETNKEDGIEIEKIYSICKKFENEGLLVSAGTSDLNSPIFNLCFYNFTFDESYAEYGSYDFLINGFLDIRNKFSQTVFPIVVQHKENKKIDIGTAFAISENNILTAKHCVENMNWIRIEKDGCIVKIKNIYIPENKNIDLAVIETEENIFAGIPILRFGIGNVLDDVLTLGYPPIAGFDAIQFSEKGTISTKYKASIGEIVGADKSYLDNMEYFLINARVKGGNSGGPVINKLGFVVGMLTQLPYDIEDSSRIDLMGFGIALPSETIATTLKGQFDIYSGENTKDGFEINMP